MVEEPRPARRGLDLLCRIWRRLPLGSLAGPGLDDQELQSPETRRGVWSHTNGTRIAASTARRFFHAMDRPSIARIKTTDKITQATLLKLSLAAPNHRPYTISMWTQ